MDSLLINMMHSGGRNRLWAETMLNQEARILIQTANSLSSNHLQDAMTRLNFVQEIKSLIEEQFSIASRAESDEECLACIKKLREENVSLEEQGRMQRMETAKIYAKVEVIRENNKVVGYVISAVHIVISGVALFGGMIMMSTMTPIGVLAGAILFVDGINGITKEVNNLYYSENPDSEGIVANAAMDTASFMGFKPESGLAFYNAISLGASAYSIFGLTRRTEAWRLFRWLPRDYYRKVDTMSKPKLTMKIVGYGIKAKVIYDLISTERSVD